MIDPNEPINASSQEEAVNKLRIIELEQLVFSILRHGESFAWRDQAMKSLGITLDDL